MRYRVYQSSLGSWFVTSRDPFHVIHIYPQHMWAQAKNAAFESAVFDHMEATA